MKKLPGYPPEMKWLDKFLEVRAELLYEFNCMGVDLQEILDDMNLNRDQALMIIAHMIKEKNAERCLEEIKKMEEERVEKIRESLKVESNICEALNKIIELITHIETKLLIKLR